MTMHKHTNREEHDNFLRVALMWRGSVTPRIILGVLIMAIYTYSLIIIDEHYYKLPHFQITPFEYTGAILGLVLVFRTNAGYDRWWEARKLWGGIVNQSRNLLIMSWQYSEENPQWRKEISKWIITFSFATKESLRLQKDFDDLTDILSEQEIAELKNAKHSPVYVASKIAKLLNQARHKQTIDLFSFQEMEKQRGILIDHLGGCERILKTPMPLVYAIKTRRFILIYLLLLPFSLINPVGLMAIFITVLVAYPLLSLDRIGYELQNPFAIKNLSHLPLETICMGIKSVGVDMMNNKAYLDGDRDKNIE
ncbi:MAG: bestrophin family ion channel [Methylococcales bacterium]|nr:bestrophin family ion channel [Methylococcales bacterium]